MKPHKNKNLTHNRRIFLFGFLKILSLFFVFERLYNLQIRQTEKYKKLAENNRINLSFILPQRGLIYDRNNNLLADNKEQYQLILKPDDVKNKFTAFSKVTEYIDIPIKKKEYLLNMMMDKNKLTNHILLKGNLSWKEVATISSNITELQGVYIEMVLVRVYNSIASSHLLGYVGKPEIKKNPKLAKVEGTKVGKLGIELAYDKQLQGKFGIKKEEVNAFGRVVNEISRVNGIPGDDINLSISKDLQDFCFQRLNNLSGSIAVMDLSNGEILALVSRPSFDSNDFINELNMEKWKSIKGDTSKPLFHRASMGTYPPGSIFKLIVALAAFDTQDFDKNKKYYCNGGFKFGDQVFHCWNEKGHGFINCEEAIAKSCDCYFYDLSLKVGIDKISETAKLYGLGTQYLEDVFSSSEGLIPTKKWKKNKYDAAWTMSDTIVASIGQGFALATPLQLVVMMSRIATNGKKIIPVIMKSKNETKNNSYYENIENYNQAAIDLIKGGMFKAVNDPEGTAFLSKISGKNIMCGKTATSQVRRISMQEREQGILKNEELPLEQRDHALFAGYFPYHNPKFSFSVVVEHGGSGSKTAAPIAKDICKKLEKDFL